MPYPDYNANFSQEYKDWSAMMESKYPFLQSGFTSALGTNRDKPSTISSLFGGGEGKYNFNNIMQGVGTVSTIDSMLSPIADMLAGQNQSTVGNVMKAIPGLSTIGGLVNAAFGSHINKDFVDSTNRQIRTMSGPLSEATTNESLLNDYLNYNELSHVAKSEVGSDGWFSHKAKKKTRALNSAIDEANIRGEHSMLNTAQNVDSNNDLMALSNYAAYGGPLSDENYYDWGGAIQMAQNAIKKHEDWRSRTYLDKKGGTPTIGWGFTNSGFRNKYKEGITNHYKRGMTQAQAQQELNWYLRNAAKTLDKIYGGFNLTDSQKAALLDTYYQRPASVSTNSRFYKALKAGDKNAVKYLGVAGYNSRNAARQAMYTSGKIPTVDINTDYVAPSDNTRVVNNAKLLHDLSEDNTTKGLASPADFSIKRSNAFAEASPIKSELPSISISPSGIDTYFASAMQTPHAQTEVTTPRLLSTEQIMRNYDNFFNSLGESDYLAEGGNLGGLQGLNNWMGQATTAFNTISNWGKEDPSLGRNYGSGKYGAAGQIGMMSYDLIKAIRDATKPKRDPIDKLGLYADGGQLFAGGGALDYANIANSVSKLASNVRAQSSIDDTTKLEKGISDFSRSLDDSIAQANTNDDILNLFNTTQNIDGRLSGRDVRDKSYFDDFLSSVPASFEGFNTGSSFGPWGAAIGAVVGGASSLIGSAIGRHKANKKARQLDRKIEEANKRVNNNLDYAVDRVDDKNDLKALQNYVAMGGSLNNRFPGGDPFGFGSTTGLNGEVYFLTHPHADGGSIHIAPSKRGTFKAQASKMGMGVQEAASHILAHKENYSPAMVKKAVFAHNFAHAYGGPLIDYLFSSGGNMSSHGADFTNGLTFVDEGGSHEENPNGGVPMGVDNNGTPNLVEEGETIWKGDYVFSDRLKVPESIRQKYHLKEGATYADASKKLSEESSDRPNDPISKRTLDVALGELSDAQEAERQSRAEATANRPQQEENIPQGEGVSEPSNQQEPNNSPTEDEMIAALNGVQGMAFGGNLFAPGGNLIPYNPYGADYKDPSLKDSLRRGNKLENLTDEQRGKGATEGWQGFPYELPANYQAPKESLTPWEEYATVAADTQDDDSQIEPQVKTKPKTAPKGKYKDTYMRYAPIAGNFAMALNSIMNDPDYSNAEAIIRAAELAGKPVSLPVDVIGDYRTRKPFDERYLTNLINQNNAAAIRASLDIAGNNRAMGLAAVLANNAQNQAKLAEAARQAYMANRADDAQVSEFNRGTNMFNAEANNRRNSAQAQLNSQRQSAMLSGLARGYALRQALDDQRAAAISQNLSAALQGLGDMGWENSQRNWLQSLADRGVLKGMFNSDGKSDFSGISNPGTSATSTSGSKKNGGKIKTKKRRF
jgi:GH24 family phage-related lysozyme (muramidase)